MPPTDTGDRKLREAKTPAVNTDRTLSHYRIVDQIGAGGMGVVYRAFDTHLERDVALKVLTPGRLSDPGARQRFRKEALALSRLNHPNISTVHDFDTDAETDFLVMEFVPGATLRELLDTGAMETHAILRLGAQLADGLATAHRASVLHRDLKPENLRITDEGRLKILDFGLAKLLRTADETGSTETATAGLVGTLAYMPPETFEGRQPDARADIYAVGAILYEMATSRRLFPTGGVRS